MWVLTGSNNNSKNNQDSQYTSLNIYKTEKVFTTLMTEKVETSIPQQSETNPKDCYLISGICFSLSYSLQRLHILVDLYYSNLVTTNYISQHSLLWIVPCSMGHKRYFPWHLEGRSRSYILLHMVVGEPSTDAALTYYHLCAGSPRWCVAGSTGHAATLAPTRCFISLSDFWAKCICTSYKTPRSSKLEAWSQWENNTVSSPSLWVSGFPLFPHLHIQFPFPGASNPHAR